MSIKVHGTSMDYEEINGIPTIYVSEDILDNLEFIRKYHHSKREAFDIMYGDSSFVKLRDWIYNNDYAEMNTREEYFLLYLDGGVDFKVKNKR